MQREFVALLYQLFQIEHNDLDFGIYRVMKVKRAEIQNYLDNDLIAQIREILAQGQSSERAGWQDELAQARENAQKAGFDPANSPVVQELERKLGGLPQMHDLESDVLAGLHAFFARYYIDGDWISRPYYRKNVYAIPYNGEEVALHWANRDQYYIKSAATLRDYRFTVAPNTVLRFALREADIETDNNKTQNGTRRWKLATAPAASTCSEETATKTKGKKVAATLQVLAPSEPLVEWTQENETRVCTVFFDYSADSAKQGALNESAAEIIKLWLQRQSERGESELEGALKLAPTAGNPQRTVLEQKLTDWTARRDFDFFVHRDLAGFLTRELDFYLKNEVLHFDDIARLDAAQFNQQQLAKLRTMRGVGQKLIAFLAQLENWQRALWEKPKWIVSSDLCLSLNRVPSELWPQVWENEAQIAEWKALYRVQEAALDLTRAAWSEPPTAEWAAQNGHVMIDSRHFAAQWKARLWESVDWSQVEGTLFHGDNYAALRLMQERYREQIKCIYIDPPYNTGGDDFLYKDNYQHSSWLSMMQNRLELAQQVLAEDGALFVSIDDVEQAKLKLLLDDIFGVENFAANVLWKKKTNGNNMGYIPPVHDFIVTYGKLLSERTFLAVPQTDEFLEGRYSNPDNDPRGAWTTTDLSANHEGPYFTITNSETGQTFLPPRGRYWVFNEEEVKKRIAEGRIIFGRSGNGRPIQRKFKSEMKLTRKEETWWDKHGINADGTKEIADLIFSKSFPNPKPSLLLESIYSIGADSDSTILDFFAGSGTTGHAVINLNRADGENGRRKYLLVEMGAYFDEVLVPRLKKVHYAAEWKDGAPRARDSGTAGAFLIHRLESYEDALHHLAQYLDAHADQHAGQWHSVPEALRDDWRLRYALSAQTQNGAVLASDAIFEHPFDIAFAAAAGSVQQRQTQTLDAVSTFNFLIGLTPCKYLHWAAPLRCVVVCGRDAQNRAVIVIWRHLHDVARDVAENALRELWNDARLADWKRDATRVFINGDSDLESWRAENQSWHLESLEAEFRRQMFGV